MLFKIVLQYFTSEMLFLMLFNAILLTFSTFFSISEKIWS